MNSNCYKKILISIEITIHFYIICRTLIGHIQ